MIIRPVVSKITLLVAVEAVRRSKPREIVIAVPTGSADRLRKVAREVDALYCANIREGLVFSAWRTWRLCGESLFLIFGLLLAFWWRRTGKRPRKTDPDGPGPAA